MSESVTVGTGGGTPRIAVDVGGVTRYASYASGSGGSALTFTYTPQEGDVDLDGVTVSSPLDLNGGTVTDLNGNAITNLTFTPPNTTNVKVDYPSLSMDFINSDYILSGTHYATLPSFLTAAGGTYARNSLGTYFDSSGNLQTVSNNVPRFDYDPTTHLAKGILIEEQRTNSTKYSEQMNNAWWTKAGLTVTADAVAAPDGTMTADRIIESAANAQHYIFDGNSLTVSTAYSLNVFLKDNGRRYIQFAGAGLQAANEAPVFDLQTGTVSLGATNTVLKSASITALPNGWYRCAANVVASGTAGFYIYLVNSSTYHGTNPSYLGDGSSGAYIWGAQLEQGRFSTSYIQTTNAAVTRQADDLRVPTGAWYNQNSGAFYEYVTWYSAGGTTYPMFWRVDDTTNNNRWNAFYNLTGSSRGVDGYNTSALQGGFSHASAVSESGKIAAAQALNNANAAYDGVLKTLDTSWAPPTVTRLILGQGVGAVRWSRQLKYYPARVADTQLQLLTQ
ncbi:MAG TPA: hypothetical protein PKI93_00095 [Alphaproteobacteria bacterium]|nr:hypothetical protein [Alphaproteobacteria bacterium]HNS43610.1 hypothetical protein [Alphaproteobacteria bacterium]